MNRICQIMNEDIAHLYASAIQYRQHACLLEGVFTQLEADLLEHSGDDIEQALWLSDKVSFYQEIPCVKIAPIVEAKPSSTSLEMLVWDLVTISDAVKRFSRHLQEITLMGAEFASVRKFYEEMLDHEEEHLNSFRNFLSPYMRDLDPSGDVDVPVEDPAYIVKLAQILRG